MSNTIENMYEGSQEREFLGHPIGLGICFMTEMWERFSYYGMRALLILFLTKYYLYSAEQASGIYGAYIGMAYMLPILGGYLADRYLGSRKAVIYGGILLVFGHFSLAFEGPPAYMNGTEVVRDEGFQSMFFFSLALIITGVGFLKANISTIVGKLYGEHDPRRDGGFTIFYMGINLGSVLSIGGVGYVGETYGWNYGFGMAGIGMLFGLLVFLWGQKFLDGRAEPPNAPELKEKGFAFLNKENTIYIFGILLVVMCWQLIQYQKVLGYALGTSGFVMVAMLLAYGFKKCDVAARGKLFVATFLIATQSLFWALFEQQGASLTLLADQQFNLHFMGMDWLPSQVQLMNALFIVMFAPVIAWMWVAMAKKEIEPSTPAKFGIAMSLIGIGYIVFAYGMGIDEGSDKSFWWLVFIYFALTMAELCLSPVGLSMVTKLSPKAIVGMVMGTWFLFSSLGNFVAGWISSLTGSGGHGASAGALDVDATMSVYNDIGLLSIGVGVVIFLLTPLMRKHMHGVH